MKISINDKSINLEVKRVSSFGKVSGLMFRSSKTQNLLFDFNASKVWAIHSYFVFFPFLALWLDEKNRLVDCNLVRPFTTLVQPKKPARKLVEIPLNKENNYIFELLVGEGKV